jgi:hypothetical protein
MTDKTPFLSRWSQRKLQARELVEAPQQVQTSPDLLGSPPGANAPTVAADTPSTRTPPDPAQALVTQPPLPTLADVAELTHESDYSRFVTQGVTPEVKHAALKKLFSDPHFNVMDGLDTYIEDYGIPNPISPEMLRMMSQTRFLGLFNDEVEPDPATPDVALTAARLDHSDPDDTARQATAALPPAIAADGPTPEPAPELASHTRQPSADHAADLDPAALRATPGAPDTPA